MNQEKKRKLEERRKEYLKNKLYNTLKDEGDDDVLDFLIYLSGSPQDFG